MALPENKSYLAAGISAFSPWGSRSTTPKPGGGEEGGEKAADGGLNAQRGGDHTVSHRHRLSLKSYPRDCPPLKVHWFHAVDVPKRKPLPSGAAPPPTDKPRAVPKKYVPFSKGDSRAIEAAFQKLSEEEDAAERDKLRQGQESGAPSTVSQESSDRKVDDDGGEVGETKRKHTVKVPVNEDYLFDVDVAKRELAPAYWLGPVYDVRRGTWFYQESAGLRPCDENLATQLEEGYLKVKPWRDAQSHQQRSASQPRTRPTSLKPGEDPAVTTQYSKSNPVTPKSSIENLRASQSPSTSSKGEDKQDETVLSQPTDKTFRLFGAHMNSVVTYQDASIAWLLTDDFLSRMSSTMYQRFAGGGHFAGVKLIRGYSDTTKKTEGKETKGSGKPTTNKTADAEKESDVDAGSTAEQEQSEIATKAASETRRKTLERHISTLVTSATPDDAEQQEEEVRKREEKEIQDDYKDQEGDEQGREIEHLLLVTHGIGQRLGLRMESVNFVHDVNMLRKTLKAVYTSSADLQALNTEVDKMPKNSRIQVLPICWRHLLDFPKQSLKHNRKEHDLGDAEFEQEDYPNLDDITIEGVPAVRNLITDLALDILLYQSPAYKGHITRIVLQECNRIYKLFRERNPSFHGKVSLIGHSLGSAIMFDILCQEKDDMSSHASKHGSRRSDDRSMKLGFAVEDFYALGSPIGLFQMLKGRTIAARQSLSGKPAETPAEAVDDPFLGPDSFTTTARKGSKLVEITTSSPKCHQIFNIFHPTDPISYRLEPLISPPMASLKPQPLPYTKRGIFGAPVGQGLTGIGARVGQSVSGLWSSFSSGIASSLLNRSLGISAEDAGKLGDPLPAPQARAPLSVGAGTNVSGGVIPTGPLPPPGTEIDKKRKRTEDGVDTIEDGEHPPTLIDSELETLYSRFQKRRQSYQSDAALRDLGENPEWQATEEQARKLRREEAKVRALNSNGRVDYSIQEGAFDISILASIASHLSYWADEDVSHFMISQLLSRNRVLRKSRSAQNIKS